MEENVDPRLIRLRVELFTCMQTLKGEDKKYFEELIDQLAQCMDIVPPRGLAVGVAAALNADEPAASSRSHISVQYDLHRKLLERAEKLLDNNNHTEACELVTAAMRLRP